MWLVIAVYFSFVFFSANCSFSPPPPLSLPLPPNLSLYLSIYISLLSHLCLFLSSQHSLFFCLAGWDRTSGSTWTPRTPGSLCKLHILKLQCLCSRFIFDNLLEAASSSLDAYCLSTVASDWYGLLGCARQCPTQPLVLPLQVKPFWSISQAFPLPFFCGLVASLTHSPPQ